MNKTVKIIIRILAVICLLSLILPFVLTARAAGTEAMETAVQNKIAQIVAGIPASADTDSEKALYLHDYVVKAVTYEEVGYHQTAYGALVEGKAVCAGYADAYKRLLNAVGIDAYTLTGTAVNSAYSGAHAWTLVYLDGKCYYTDVTWDDPFVNGAQLDEPSHAYFNLTLEEISRDHFLDSASQALVPGSCNHTGNDYYAMMQGIGAGVGIFNDATTAQEAAKYFVLASVGNGTAAYSCDFRFDGTDMIGWLSNNWAAIAGELGLSGRLSLGYMPGDNKCSMTVSGSAGAISAVSVTAVALNNSRVNLTAIGESYQLTVTVAPANATNKSVSYSSSDPSVAVVDANGRLTAVGSGSAVITVTSADGGKTDTCAVTVTLPTVHTHDAPLRSVGAKAATCEGNGNTAYYVCDGCGKWFADAGAGSEITDKNSVNTSPSGHTASGWERDNANHWKKCTAYGCGKLIPGSKAAHNDGNSDRKCDSCGFTIPAQNGQTADPSATEPAETTRPPEDTQSTGTTQATAPTQSPEGTGAVEPTGTVATDSSSPSDGPTGATVPTEEQEGQKPGGDPVVIIVIAGVVTLGGGAGAAGYFLYIRKKNL